jgi:hypothetical protein
MKDLGLLAAGYNWINLDDCYASKNRSISGEIVAGPVHYAGICVFLSNLVMTSRSCQVAFGYEILDNQGQETRLVRMCQGLRCSR